MALAKPEIPRAKRRWQQADLDVREVVNGLMYPLSIGCQWRAIPKDLPPRSTVNHHCCRGSTMARSTDFTPRAARPSPGPSRNGREEAVCCGTPGKRRS